MIGIVVAVGLLWIFYVWIKRCLPVKGVFPVDLAKEPLQDNVVCLDVRDYNLAAATPVKGVYHLPYAYLKRHYGEIESKEIILIVSDSELLNLAVRFLRKKGFHIKGWYFPTT